MMPEESPITGLLERIDIDPKKVAIITQTLQKMSVFNEVVRQQVAAMSVGSATRRSPQPSIDP